MGIDVRNRNSDLANLPEWLSAVGALGLDPQLVFFDTTDDVCSSATPTPAAGIRSATSGWRWPMRFRWSARCSSRCGRLADSVIDTSELNVHQLRRQMTDRVRPELRRRPVAAVRVVRLPARRAGRCGLRVRRAGAAQSALGPATAPACRGATRPCATTWRRSRRASLRRPGQRFLDTWLPRLRARHPQLRHHRLRLHRRPAPLGVPGRTPGHALPRTRAGTRSRPTIANWISRAASPVRTGCPAAIQDPGHMRCRPFCPDSHLARTWFGSASRA